MSRTEVHKGKATPLNMDVHTFLDSYPELVEDHYRGQEDLSEIFYNGLKCGYDKYILFEGLVYSLDNTELDEYNISFAEGNDDGSFNYFVSFYNGGCGLSEAIGDALRKAA